MRNSLLFACLLVTICAADILAYSNIAQQRSGVAKEIGKLHLLIGELGLSDIVVATEARYTRHPSCTDAVVPFMDHPGSLEHFPTGSFWRPAK